MRENDEVSRETLRLPKEKFKDIRGANINCWRLETVDGQTITAKDWKIERYIEGTVVLVKVYRHDVSGDAKDRSPRELEIQRIVSLWPIPIKKGENTILAERISTEGSNIRVVDVHGQDYLIAHGEAQLINLKTEPDFLSYGFDGKEEITGLSASLVGDFLRDGRKRVKSDYYTSIPITEIKKLEFEKEWPPTVILVVLGIMLPVGVAALGAQPGQPGRCPFD